MCLQLTVQVILAFVLCHRVLSDITNASHHSQNLITSNMDVSGNNTSRHKSLPVMAAAPPNNDLNTTILVPAYIYPYILLALWITCISAIICCCLYCKCQQAERMTSYNTNSFELQEVHVLDHPLPHVNGCVCLCCLQRQVAQELQLKRPQ